MTTWAAGDSSVSACIASVAPFYHKLKKRVRSKPLPSGLRICVTSKRQIGQTRRRDSDIPNDTEVGHMARNELDTHADTCCAGANWALLEYIQGRFVN